MQQSRPIVRLRGDGFQRGCRSTPWCFSLVFFPPPDKLTTFLFLLGFRPRGNGPRGYHDSIDHDRRPEPNALGPKIASWSGRAAPRPKAWKTSRRTPSTPASSRRWGEGTSSQVVSCRVGVACSSCRYTRLTRTQRFPLDVVALRSIIGFQYGRVPCMV